MQRKFFNLYISFKKTKQIVSIKIMCYGGIHVFITDGTFLYIKTNESCLKMRNRTRKKKLYF